MYHHDPSKEMEIQMNAGVQSLMNSGIQLGNDGEQNQISSLKKIMDGEPHRIENDFYPNA